MTDPKADDDLALYMSTNSKESPNNVERVAFKLNRHKTVRDLYKYRRMEKEEFESYRDKEYRDSQINKLQGQFRDNFIERLAVVTTLRELGHQVVDELIPSVRPAPDDKVEEAEVLAYMAREGPSHELPTDSDRKAYFQKRYSEVKEAYWFLKLQQEEAEQYKDKAYREKLIDKLKGLYRKNQTERIAVVLALRRIGDTVDDPFVPLSKI